MQITLPDGSTSQHADNASALDVAASIGEGLAKAAIGARVKATGTTDETILIDINRPIADALTGVESVDISIVTAPRFDKKGKSKWRDEQHEKDALYLLRHSCAHVMAEAIEAIYPGTQLAYGPPLDKGYYYDLALDTPISTDDFEKIEAKMQEIAQENRPFTRYELDTTQGMDRLKTEANKYKIDNAEKAIAGGASILSWYVTGDVNTNWEDLCMGPHVPTTAPLAQGAFKLMSVATSHWHGDVGSDRFQRVYGTAFFSQADLDEHLEQLEQAKARDHRVVGKQLGLFEIDDQVGQGLILWKPNGAIVRQELQTFILEHLERQGYSQVFTPHIGKLDLYRTSGHYPYYQDSQFPTILTYDEKAKPLMNLLQKARNENKNPDPEEEKRLVKAAGILDSEYPWNEVDPLKRHAIARALSLDGATGLCCSEIAHKHGSNQMSGYLLKPMNCPHHIKIFASEKHSYRDLPIRLAEFGTVYRWEQSGELNGMTRVRGFTQDDAHLFVTEDQLEAELNGCLELVKIVFTTLGMADYRVRIGLRDPDSSKYVGEASKWDAAENILKDAAAKLGVDFKAEAGEAAFYGPKIDFVARDVIGREWQLGTVQVDYNLPERFDLTYIGPDNQAHRPVMIHRAPFGSLERFIGVLIEHFNGAFPLWLSPEQIRILPISDKFMDYAHKVKDALKAKSLRVSIDQSSDRINAKVKSAQEAKVPYMLIVGGKDEEAGNVSVRHRAAGEVGAVPLETFVEAVTVERDERRLEPMESLVSKQA